jgi:ABC-type Fe3+ transport system permease subunit
MDDNKKPSIPVMAIGMGGVGVTTDESHQEESTVNTNHRQEENWVKSYWRPAMGWLYMAICAFDFIIFPMIMIFSTVLGIQPVYKEWTSLTLSNGGLIHFSFGAILGVAAYTRGLEKLYGKN